MENGETDTSVLTGKKLKGRTITERLLNFSTNRVILLDPRS